MVLESASRTYFKKMMREARTNTINLSIYQSKAQNQRPIDQRHLVSRTDDGVNVDESKKGGGMKGREGSGGKGQGSGKEKQKTLPSLPREGLGEGRREAGGGSSVRRRGLRRGYKRLGFICLFNLIYVKYFSSIERGF
jgi:hypothetical protein